MNEVDLVYSTTFSAKFKYKIKVLICRPKKEITCLKKEDSVDSTYRASQTVKEIFTRIHWIPDPGFQINTLKYQKWRNSDGNSDSSDFYSENLIRSLNALKVELLSLFCIW